MRRDGTTLTEIVGIGRVGAATILATVGDARRFSTAAAFATYNGAEPIAASSGDQVRYRLNRGGKRQLNKVLHTAAKTSGTHPRISGTRLRAAAAGQRRLPASARRRRSARSWSAGVPGEDKRMMCSQVE